MTKLSDIDVTLAGRPFKLRPTWAAMDWIEQITGRGIVPIARDVAESNIAFRDMAAIFTAGIQAGGEKIKHAEVAALVMQAGVLNLVGPASEFLHAAIFGTGAEAEPEEEAAPEPQEVEAEDQLEASKIVQADGVPDDEALQC